MCDQYCFVLQNLNICSAYYACEAFILCNCEEHNNDWNVKTKKFFELYRKIDFGVARKMDCSPHNALRQRFSEAKCFQDIQNMFDKKLTGDCDLDISLLSIYCVQLKK